MALLDFTASAIQLNDRPTYEDLPAGQYEMMIIRSTTKATRNGDGEYLELEMQVLNGPHTNRRHLERLNLNNQNPIAVRIAEESLARLCRALDLDVVTDSEQLHDKPFLAVVKPDKKDPARTRVVDYFAADDKPEPKPAAKPAPKASTGKPWG